MFLCLCFFQFTLQAIVLLKLFTWGNITQLVAKISHLFIPKKRGVELGLGKGQESVQRQVSKKTQC